MKNLKRVLCLALAMFMLLGMMVVASAADKTYLDLEDWDEVTQKEAVALMVDLKIIEGDEKGFFNPKGEINRGGWCKLTYIAKYGQDDNPIGNPSLTDVKGWYSGYVAAMEADGVVSGNGDGTFSPEDPITVLGAAKTLLTVLGWNSDLQGFSNNNNWKNNIKRMATAKGLFNGLIEQDVNKNLTREDAAQMIYNVLSCNMVYSDIEFNANGKPYIKSQSDTRNYLTGTANDGVTLGAASFNGLTPVTAVVANVANGKAVFTVNGTNLAKPDGTASTIVATDVNGKIAASAADVGKTVTFFVTPGTTTGSVVVKSSLLGEAPVVALASTTAGIDFADNTGASSKNKYTEDKTSKAFLCELDAKVFYTINGGALTESASSGGSDNTLATVCGGANALKSGTKVEFFDTTGTGKADLIRIYKYDVKKVTADPKVVTDTTVTPNVDKVTIAGLSITSAEVAKVDGYEDIKKDDIVLVYNDATNGTYVIEKLEGFNGSVTGASSDGKLTIGGKQYSRSGIATTGATPSTTITDTFASWGVAANKDNEYSFYLDKNGDICFAELVSGSGSTTDYTKVAVILDIGTATVQGTTDKYGSTGTNTVYKAELLYEDGTHGVVTIASIDGKVPADADKAASGSDPAEVKWVKNGGSVSGGYADAQPWATAFNYELDEDGNTVLTKVTAAGSGTPAVITASNIKMEGTPGIDKTPTYTGNAKTVYVIEDTSSGKAETYAYSTKTGYANAPKISSTNAKAVVVGNATSNVVSYVFVTTDAFTDAEATGMYFLKDTDFEQTLDGVKLNVIDPDGKDTKLLVSKTVAFGASGTTLQAPFTTALRFFKITSEKDGVVTGVNTTAGAIDPGTNALTVLGDNLYKIGSTAAAPYTDDFTMIVIDEVTVSSVTTVTGVTAVKAADAGTIDISVDVTVSGTTVTGTYANVYGYIETKGTTLYIFRVAKP